MKPIERIILALDVSDYNEAVEIATNFKEHIEIFKVGSELFTSAGPKIIETIHAMGKKVFLDLKFYDIPNTVTRSSLAVAKIVLLIPFNKTSAVILIVEALSLSIVGNRGKSSPF